MTARRSLAASFFATPRPSATLGAVVAAGALAAQLLSHQKPWAPHAPIELSNQLIAAMAFAWAALQLWTGRADRGARRGWGLACLGLALIALEDSVDLVAPFKGHAAASVALTSGLWLAAAAALFAWARRHAFRRSVTAAMRAGLTTQLATHGLAFAAILAASASGHGHAALIDTLAEAGELIAVLTYVAALFLAVFAPVKTYRAPASELGARAREIFRDFRLARTARYPTPYRALGAPVLRQLTHLAMALWFAPRAAASAARDGGGRLPRQLVRMAGAAARGIDPLSFYLFGLYRAGAAPDAAAALTRAETKNGLTAALQATGGRPTGARDLNDKLAFWRVCREHGLPCAPVLARLDRGSVETYADHAAFDRDLFVKDQRGRGGRRTFEFRRAAPFLYRDGRGRLMTVADVFARLAEAAPAERLIILPRLANHVSVARFAEEALVVFRVVTCLDEHDEPCVTHGVLRALARFEPAWPRFPDGEWDAAIDVETGALGPFFGDCAETCGERHEAHPVTGARAAGVTLDLWPAIAATAVAAHRVFASRLFVGWDVALTADGPVLLEGNSNMDVSVIQRVSGPIGASRLGRLIDRRLDRLVADRLEAEERRSGRAAAAGLGLSRA